MSQQNKKSETATREEEVLAFWNDGKIFEKSLNKDAPNGEFVFFDGPPFATGLPHAGSLLSSVVKDVVGRYKTMQGYTVPRRWGWDCHGLPIENMIEKKLELKTKKDIEELGIDKFNEEAKSTVLKYVDDWKSYVERIGRWVDFDNSYKTMDNTYIESVWWALKKIHSDKRLYEGKKVLMYCPRCETPLSKAEIAMDNSYKDVTEEAVFVEFRVLSSEFPENTSILAWTTTPWTLPGNVALAVGEDIDYVIIEKKDEGTGPLVRFILAKELLENVFKDVEYEIVKEVKGKDLVGTAYEPLYQVEKAVEAKSKKAWTVQAADFVTTEDGTGVVHTAPMYGEDDYNFGLEHELPIIPILDATGTYNDDAPEIVRGMYHKKGGKVVMGDLEERGLLFTKHNNTHSYPHCYRCGTALIYNALSSWFINIQDVKQKLLDANEEVTWYPEHLKHGRFKHIVESAPDWTISRNRFWASPLPIWKNEKTDEVTVFGSVDELREHTAKSGNTYYFMRHGEAESNVQHIISSLPENEHHVTEKGKEQVLAAAKDLKGKGITKIITSPLIRTRESAEIIATELGIEQKDIITEERFEEWQLDDLNGKGVGELKKVCPTPKDRFMKGCGTGETLVEMKHRIGEALYELEEQYKDETILIVAHEYTLWLATCVARGADVDECIEIRGSKEDFVTNAEVVKIDFVPIPHNREYELDLHRPYIDDVKVVSKNGDALVRIPEVVDCWVESGSMPFASEHYPHENEDVVKRRYPGDFIAEYIAQTRTWFYYMHAMGVLLFDAPSFKNCVTTGTLLAADGAKISKSKNNFTDPLINIDMYGADAMRFYMLGSVVMNAEDVAFKDDELRDVHNRYINMLWNTYKFYVMHTAVDAKETPGNSPHVLDKWIMAQLHKLVAEVTDYMDTYNTVRSARALREFVADLSQWYTRRSRDRFKTDDDDKRYALATMREVLLTVAKLTAPLTPYIAESIYRGVGGEEESVHLALWPERTGKVDENIGEHMAEVRRVASVALEHRQREGIKVRQPLASITLKNTILDGKEELLAILLDEINVKACLFDATQEDEMVLNTELTPELKLEGAVRDLVRAVQDMRKKEGLQPQDSITLMVATGDEGREVLTAGQDDLASIAGVTTVTIEKVEDGTNAKIGTTDFTLKIVKQ